MYVMLFGDVFNTRDGGFVVYDHGSIYGPRLQVQHQWFVLERGRCRLQIASGPCWELREGMCVLLCPKRVETFYFDQGQAAHSWVYLPEKVLSSISDERRSGLVHRPHMMGPDLRSLASFVLSSSLRPPQSWPTLCLALLEELESELMAPVQHGGTSEQQSMLRRLNRDLRDRLEHRWSLAEMSELVGCSVSHLVKICKLHLGRPPLKHLQKLRVDQARAMLKDTNMVMGEIALYCGFVDRYHFSKVFKQETGHSPARYRKQIWACSERDLGLNEGVEFE